MKWHMHAGGTSAHHGHGYTAHPPKGEYHIDAPQRRHGGYSVMFANTRGVIGGGLWHRVGTYRSPNEAKRAAADHYARILNSAPGDNPGGRMAKRARGGGRDYSDLLLWGGLAFVLYKAGALTSLGIANAGGVPTMTQAQLATLNSLGTAVLALGVLSSGDVALNNGWFIRPDGTLVA